MQSFWIDLGYKQVQGIKSVLRETTPSMHFYGVVVVTPRSRDGSGKFKGTSGPKRSFVCKDDIAPIPIVLCPNISQRVLVETAILIFEQLNDIERSRRIRLSPFLPFSLVLHVCQTRIFIKPPQDEFVLYLFSSHPRCAFLEIVSSTFVQTFSIFWGSFGCAQRNTVSKNFRCAALIMNDATFVPHILLPATAANTIFRPILKLKNSDTQLRPTKSARYFDPTDSFLVFSHIVRFPASLSLAKLGFSHYMYVVIHKIFPRLLICFPKLFSICRTKLSRIYISNYITPKVLHRI